ncbi:MAG: tetratricopeptide repeat protein [Nitrospiraceae bacterium]
MKQRSFIVALALFMLTTLIACDSGSTDGGAKRAGTGPDAPLVTPPSSAARMDNDEGVGHYQQGHWDVAAEHFRKAVKADPNSPAAHYNLGLTQDKMGKHDEATGSFKKAIELAPDDPMIKDSDIVKKHIGT